ncbi:hypothetical protein B9Z19DRAFT_1128508 [Tuber borchii]|uniref:Uncharacterized protein n=1 Tax=Tuber borchii TaxID=42251 RepID=A0A2T6ZP29_TUBBO|nr:hypothetical protein B9Z19DRAFT_1128508 [Tuber borchii]
MSFYAIPTFPEKSYGYLNCEQDVADGIKKLFRGVKVRVEDARPDTFVPRGIPHEEVKGEKDMRKHAKKDGVPTPALQITILRIIHPLEALYKPTTATPYSSAISPTNTSFCLGFSLGSSCDVNEDEDEDMLGDEDEHLSSPMTSMPPYLFTTETFIGLL